MPRYRMTIEYDGSAFAGWQVQEGVATVQGTCEEALQVLAKQPVHVMGSGRTDAGVHARGQVAAFDLPEERDVTRLLWSLEGILPPTIGLSRLERCADDFHPRYGALWRRYAYTMMLRRQPLWAGRAWGLKGRRPDPSKMAEEAALFVGTHDFLPFAIPRNDGKHTLCRIDSSHIEIGDGLLTYHVQGNRFLYRMVRALVGHLVEVGCGRMAQGSGREILEGRLTNPRRWAPCEGLVLEEVKYADY